MEGENDGDTISHTCTILYRLLVVYLNGGMVYW